MLLVVFLTALPMKSFLHSTRMAFSRELARHLAARLGESESAVSKALLGMVPVVLCQTIIRTGDGEGKAIFTQVVAVPLAALQHEATVTELLGLLGSSWEKNGTWAIGGQLLQRLFGPQLPALTEFMHKYAGLRSGSAAVLLQLVAAIMATGLARHVAQQQLGSPQLIAELATAKNLAYGWLPANLSHWPGYRPRTAVRAPHAVWAAELARPYWMLVLAAGFIMLLTLMFVGVGTAPASPSISNVQAPSMRMQNLGGVNSQQRRVALP